MIPSPANFWQAFALSCASQHLQETQQERKKGKTRRQDKVKLSPAADVSWQLNPNIARRVRPKVAGMRAWASPQVLPSKRPASDKGKEDRSSRSLSSPPVFPYVSLSLPSRFVLNFERWRTNYSRQLFLSWKQSGSRCAIRGEKAADDSPADTRLCARRGGRVREKKFASGHIQLCVVESPFVYTCDRWMGLLVAAPSSFRSPKSPALSKSNNCAYRTADTRDHQPKHVCSHI